MNQKNRGVLNTPNVSFVAEDNSVRYLLEYEDPYNGYEYVDLGLPSGLKWATCNVGASNPQDYGLYFAWGETTGYTANQVKDGERSFSSSVYNSGPAASISTDLTLEQDAAHAYMGGKWRMPTKAEFQELKDNCTSTWTTNYNSTGVNGRLFKSNTNGNSIFLPTSGRYSGSSVDYVGFNGYLWSSTWDSWSLAFTLYFDSRGIYSNSLRRYYGYLVRGVCE